jgi:FkbH-like protein
MSDQKSLRLAILCSFNLELIARNLETALQPYSIEVQLYFSAYSQWESDAINPGSALYQFAPDMVVVFAEFSDLAPVLTARDAYPTQSEAQNLGESAWLRVEVVLQRLLANLPAQVPIFCHNLQAAPITSLGLLEGNDGYTFSTVAEIFNQKLRDRTTREPRLLLFNYAGFLLQQGWHTCYDARLWHLGRMRFSRTGLKALAASYTQYLTALMTPRRKCLVLDLDNTLWGGVIGEEGLLGIQLGHEGVGLAYREFQMAALALSRRGVILATCSKNNIQDALTVLRDHPDTVLRPEDFACLEINWATKPENLRRIAETLNIGVDSLVFWDDSPIERDLVRHELPEVLVVEVPDDPSEYAAHLLELHCFDTLSLTTEDQQRQQMYYQQVQRNRYLEQIPSDTLEDFYTSLDIKVIIATANPFTLPRIAQLTQRTNQFNFTARRYSEQDIQGIASDRQNQLYTLQVQDRFGDLGIVGAAIIHCDGPQWILDNLLISCRALGRSVEDAFLSYLAQQASTHNATLCGAFKPTAKNAPALAFLKKYNLAPPVDWQGEDWGFAVPSSLVQQPIWITFSSESANVTA